MITKPIEYWRLLYAIQDPNNRHGIPEGLRLPEDEPIYNIDLQTRLIKGPKFLSVQRDHRAETVYFKCARYVESTDLTNTACIIQYYDPKGEPHIYEVPFYITEHDAEEAEQDTILIPWVLDDEATAAAGNIEYAFRFYLVNGDSVCFDYCLNTLPATGEIKYGLDAIGDASINYPATQIEELLSRIKVLEGNYELYWLEAN